MSSIPATRTVPPSVCPRTSLSRSLPVTSGPLVRISILSFEPSQRFRGSISRLPGRRKAVPYPALSLQLAIADRVHFLGMTRRIPLLMRSTDVFVIPSRYEPYGLVVLEAMASGLPVILSSNVGAAEFARASSMVLADAEDAEKLAGYLSRLLVDRASLRAMAEAGLQVASELSWAKMAQRYINLYHELSC